MNNFNKEHYKKIIGEALIREGYMNEPSFSEKLDEIITTTFAHLEELILKNKYTFEDKDINEWTDSDFIEYEKCQPDYIQSLPGTLRSTDPKELQLRLDTINNRLKEIDDLNNSREEYISEQEQEIDDLKNINEELQKNLDDFDAKENEFIKQNQEMQTEAVNQWIDDFDGSFEEWVNSAPGEYNVTGLVDEDRLNYIMANFSRYFFKYKGFLTTEEVEEIKGYANDIDIIASALGDTNYNDATDEWSQMGMFLSDELRDYADKYDFNKHPISNTLLEINDAREQGLPQKWANQISDNNQTIDRTQSFIDSTRKIQAVDDKEKTDLEDNKIKTQDRLNYINNRSEK